MECLCNLDKHYLSITNVITWRSSRPSKNNNRQHRVHLYLCTICVIAIHHVHYAPDIAKTTTCTYLCTTIFLFPAACTQLHVTFPQHSSFHYIYSFAIAYYFQLNVMLPMYIFLPLHISFTYILICNCMLCFHFISLPIAYYPMQLHIAFPLHKFYYSLHSCPLYMYVLQLNKTFQLHIAWIFHFQAHDAKMCGVTLDLDLLLVFISIIICFTIYIYFIAQPKYEYIWCGKT